MSIFMTLRVQGDGARLEQAAEADSTTLQAIVRTAREHGVISHRFYATATEVLVIDEWPNQRAFEAFFQEEGERIKRVMDSAGVTTAPEITFWRKLDTRDDVG